MHTSSAQSPGRRTSGWSSTVDGIAANPAVLVLIAGMAAMFMPRFWLLLSDGIWSTDEHSHGPVILVTALWLLWMRIGELDPSITLEPSPVLGWLCLVLGAALYVLGIAFEVVYFEVGAFIPMLAGCVLLIGGRVVALQLAFPLCFFVFMVPVPGFIQDPVGSFMKGVVSVAAEQLLYALGYPIARTGVVLQIGSYQLLVAEACAGMRTLFLLEAFGILYLNVVRHTSMLRNVMLAILIVPISFAANVIRVVVLALITYHYGDAAGQGFMHSFSGLVLFVSACLLTIAVDTLLRFMSRKLETRR